MFVLLYCIIVMSKHDFLRVIIALRTPFWPVNPSGTLWFFRKIFLFFIKNVKSIKKKMWFVAKNISIHWGFLKSQLRFRFFRFLWKNWFQKKNFFEKNFSRGQKNFLKIFSLKTSKILWKSVLWQKILAFLRFLNRNRFFRFLSKNIDFR